jgi:hypothetical protein
MAYHPFISIAAALLLGSSLAYAAPDRGDKREDRGASNQDRSFQQDRGMQGDRSERVNRGEIRRNEVRQEHRDTVKRGEIRRDEVRRDRSDTVRKGEIRQSEPRKYTPHPVKPLPSRTAPKPSERRSIAPVKRQPLPGNFVRVDRHRHYYRPPGAKPIRHYQRPGYVVRRLPRLAVTLSLGGLFFYYADGLYYRHYNNTYIVTAPPVGLIVTTLPVGYTVFVLGGRTYYYYADVYYVWDTRRSGYRVVEAPLDYSTYQPGEIVDTLPDGARSVTIDGVQYYRYADVYFMQAIQGDRIVYIVVTP